MGEHKSLIQCIFFSPFTNSLHNNGMDTQARKQSDNPWDARTQLSHSVCYFYNKKIFNNNSRLVLAIDKLIYFILYSFRHQTPAERRSTRIGIHRMEKHKARQRRRLPVVEFVSRWRLRPKD